MIIRTAEIRDLQAMLDIYNHEVINGTATLDLRPKTYEERLKWFYEHNTENHPLIVAETNKNVSGYASLSSYREKEAYKSTVELSVYVRAEYRGRKIGTALMEKILSMAREDESIRNVVSVITSGNEASIKLHRKFGFARFGKMHNAAVKFNKLVDVEFFELLV